VEGKPVANTVRSNTLYLRTEFRLKSLDLQLQVCRAIDCASQSIAIPHTFWGIEACRSFFVGIHAPKLSPQREAFTIAHAPVFKFLNTGS
jgi:hypothetical protein